MNTRDLVKPPIKIPRFRSFSAGHSHRVLQPDASYETETQVDRIVLELSENMMEGGYCNEPREVLLREIVRWAKEELGEKEAHLERPEEKIQRYIHSPYSFDHEMMQPIKFQAAYHPAPYLLPQSQHPQQPQQLHPQATSSTYSSSNPNPSESVHQNEIPLGQPASQWSAPSPVLSGWNPSPPSYLPYPPGVVGVNTLSPHPHSQPSSYLPSGADTPHPPLLPLPQVHVSGQAAAPAAGEGELGQLPSPSSSSLSGSYEGKLGGGERKPFYSGPLNDTCANGPCMINAQPPSLVFIMLTHKAIRAGLLRATEILMSGKELFSGLKLFNSTSRLIDFHWRNVERSFERVATLGVDLGPDNSAETLAFDHADSENQRNAILGKIKAGHCSEKYIQDLKIYMNELHTLLGKDETLFKIIGHKMQKEHACDAEECELIIEDMAELVSHAAPFTVQQLCKTSPYDCLKLYVECLRTACFCGETYRQLSRTILIASFETQPRYAARLLADEVVAPDPANSPSSPNGTGGGTCNQKGKSTLRQSFPSLPNDIKTLEEATSWVKEVSAAAGRSGWTWRSIVENPPPLESLCSSKESQRNSSHLGGVGGGLSQQGGRPYEDYLRAEKLHLQLAEQFSQPLMLQHIHVENDDNGTDKTIYFFIANEWEIGRCALFAKSYTKIHKERGKRMHIVIIDAKERREKNKGGDKAPPTSPDSP